MGQETLRLSLAVVAALFAALHAEPVAGSPPPPGWDERYRAQACGTAPTARPVATTARRLSRREAGVVTLGPGVRFDGALELRYEPALGQVLGIGRDLHLGLLLATERGEWLRLPQLIPSPQGAAAAEAFRMSGAREPAVETGEVLGSIVIGERDGSVIRYDFAFCGLSAKPQPVGRVTAGGVLTTLGNVADYLGGFGPVRYLLAGGLQDRHYGETAFALSSQPIDVKLGPPLSPAHPSDDVRALAGWDLEGGCDAVRFVRQGRIVEARSFCSPDFSEETTEVRGDVGVHVKRSAQGKTGVLLASFSCPVAGASGGLILCAPEAGRFTLIFLSARAARYVEQRERR